MSHRVQFASDSAPGPQIRIRGRSLMALSITPELPMPAWFAELDEQLRVSRLLLERPIIVDLSLALAEGGPDGVAIVLEGLEARGLRLAAVENVEAAALARTRWESLARGGVAARPLRELVEPVKPASAPARAPALVLDRPVRSGQTVVFEEGDVTVVGAVASGAEVIAGGSIHIYGPLRGRAIAGIRIGEAARVFCRKLEAELVGVGRHYRTAEDWGAGLQGRAVQAWCDRGALRLVALD
jgi:septum site-determining protein MinC